MLDSNERLRQLLNAYGEPQCLVKGCTTIAPYMCDRHMNILNHILQDAPQLDNQKFWDNAPAMIAKAEKTLAHH